MRSKPANKRSIWCRKLHSPPNSHAACGKCLAKNCSFITPNSATMSGWTSGSDCSITPNLVW